jgi:hypothetical protein
MLRGHRPKRPRFVLTLVVACAVFALGSLTATAVSGASPLALLTDSVSTDTGSTDTGSTDTGSTDTGSTDTDVQSVCRNR